MASGLSEIIAQIEGSDDVSVPQKIVEWLDTNDIPTIPFNESVGDEYAQYDRTELCSQEMRIFLFKLLRECAIQIDELQWSELIEQPHLQQRLIHALLPESIDIADGMIRDFVAFVRDGIRARVIIDDLFEQGIVIMDGIPDRDTQVLQECFRRCSLGLNLEILEADAQYSKEHYSIRPNTETATSHQYPYTLRDRNGVYNEGFYQDGNDVWHMAPLDLI